MFSILFFFWCLYFVQITSMFMTVRCLILRKQTVQGLNLRDRFGYFVWRIDLVFMANPLAATFASFVLPYALWKPLSVSEPLKLRKRNL